MNLAATNKTFLDTYLGSTAERKNRKGFDYGFYIKLRNPQKERRAEAKMSTKQQQLRERDRREFLLKNMTNQRWPMSLQSINISISLNSNYHASSQTGSLSVQINQEYRTYQSRRDFLKELIKTRRRRAARNEENEFRNPLFVPLRGLDEDENDRDYMQGREIRRELRNSAEFEMMFDKYVCEREEVASELRRKLEDQGLGGRTLTEEEVEAGLNELKIERREGQSDEAFFKDCLNHFWGVLSDLQAPDFSNRNENGITRNSFDKKIIQNLIILVDIFKRFYRNKIAGLDTAILALAMSHHLLNLNHFWRDLRDFMRDETNSGLKSIILNIGQQSHSQLLQEALIELVSDLSFSDFEGQKVNKILYQDCLPVVEKWLQTQHWNSQQTFACFIELLEDLLMSQSVYIKPQEAEKEEKQFELPGNQLGESESEEEKEEYDSESEEEKQMEHGMEDITHSLGLKPKSEKKLLKEDSQRADDPEKSEIYYRKDEKFLKFLCQIFYNLLNLDYKLNLEAELFSQALEKSTLSQDEEQQAREGQDSIQGELEENENKIDIEVLKQIQMEDDGIDLGSETTTEPSEYSEDIIEDQDIDYIISKSLLTFCSIFRGLATDNNYYVGPKFTINPKKYTKDEKIEAKFFIDYLMNWIKETQPAEREGEEQFKYIDKYMRLGQENYYCDLYFLAKLKYSQFFHMDAENQLEFLTKLDYNELEIANFKQEDFHEDLVPCLLRRGLRDFPRVYQISNVRNGLWGNFFYSRPYPKPGVTLEEQYNEPKWVDRAKKFNEALDEICKIIKTSEEEATILAKFMYSSSSQDFAFFIRSMLKPEIGHPLKIVNLKELKREDFLPFKIDNGFRSVKGDLSKVYAGDRVYTHQRIPLNMDFDENQPFYVYGPNAICTRNDLKKTREEIQEYPDEYLFYEGDDDGGNNDDEDEEFAFDQAIIDRFERDQAWRTRERDRNGEAGKDEKNEEQEAKKLYRLKRYSILEFKARSSKKLTKKEKIDKLDNRVSTDMLRSGAAIIRKLRHPPLNFLEFDNQNQNHHYFMREPLYYMYVAKEFFSGCSKKFTSFEYKRFFFSTRMEWNEVDEDLSNNYQCLYVKRLKKVVFRGKIFRQRFTGQNKILSLERIHCKGKVPNFDDPIQRDPYHDRIFRLRHSITKNNRRVTHCNFLTGILPSVPKCPLYFSVDDYTLRTRSVIKSDCLAKQYYNHSKSLEFYEEEGLKKMSHSDEWMKTLKVMERGQDSSYQPIDRTSVVFVKKDYYGRGSSFYDAFGNEPMAYNNKRYSMNYQTIHFDVKTEIAISWVYRSGSHRDDSSTVKYYNNKVQFNYIKKLDGEDERYFEVARKGSRKVFRFLVEGDPFIAVSTVFRRLYLLEVKKRTVGLRVVTFDALDEYINKFNDE